MLHFVFPTQLLEGCEFLAPAFPVSGATGGSLFEVLVSAAAFIDEYCDKAQTQGNTDSSVENSWSMGVAVSVVPL